MKQPTVRSMARDIAALCKSDSVESDQILAAVSGDGAEDAQPVRHPKTGRFLPASDPAVVEAVKVLRNPSANATERRIAASVISTAGNGGDVVPVLPAAVDASNVGSVGSTVDAKYIADLQGRIASNATSAHEKETAGNLLTKALLEASHVAPAVAKGRGVEVEWSAAERAQLAKLERAIAIETDPAKRDAAGAVLTYARLVKQTMDEGAQQVTAALMVDRQAAATIAAVRAYQQANTHAQQPATGVSSEAQTRLIGSGNGTPQNLGVATGANGGNLTGAQGRTEPEPAAVAARLEDELAKGGLDSLHRARLGEELTLLRLRNAVAA